MTAVKAPAKSILIAGIGNIFLGDDAFGVEVARRLESRKWPRGVRAVDFGIRGYDLAFAMLDGVDLTIFIDAAPRGGAPGSLYLIEPDVLSGSGEMDPHGMNPMAVLELVRTMGGEIRRLLVVGCEPEFCGERMGLSPSVESSVAGAVEMIEDLVRREREGELCFQN